MSFLCRFLCLAALVCGCRHHYQLLDFWDLRLDMLGQGFPQKRGWKKVVGRSILPKARGVDSRAGNSRRDPQQCG